MTKWEQPLVISLRGLQSAEEAERLALCPQPPSEQPGLECVKACRVRGQAKQIVNRKCSNGKKKSLVLGSVAGQQGIKA